MSPPHPRPHDWPLKSHTKPRSIYTTLVEASGIQALAQPQETLPRESRPQMEEQAASQATGPPSLGIFKVEITQVLRPFMEGLCSLLKETGLTARILPPIIRPGDKVAEVEDSEVRFM